MKDLLLKITNPLEFDITGYDLQFTETETEYISQKLRIVLSFFTDEWYLDKNEGLPFYADIFKKNPDINLISDLYKDRILAVPEVDELLDFDIVVDSATRETQKFFTVTTANGETVEVSI